MSSTKPVLPSSPATKRKPSKPLRKNELEAVLSYLYLITDVVHPSPRCALDLVEFDECRPLVPIATRTPGLSLFFVTEARSIGDRGLRMGHEPRATLRAELHIGSNLGAALSTI